MALNPVDAFVNRKAKSGVRKIEVAELEGPGSHTSEYIYHDSTPRAGDLQARYSSHSLFFEHIFLP